MADIIDEPLDDQPQGDAELTTVETSLEDDNSTGTGGTDSDGQPRDQAGRYAPKAKADEAQTTDGLAADPNAATPDAQAEAVASGPAAAAATPATPAPSAPVPAWSVKALGQSYEIPGTTVNADGTITATPDGARVMHEYIGKGVKYDREFPRLRQELERVRSQRTEQDEHNAIIAQEFARMATLDDRELMLAVQEFRQAYPTLKAQAENNLLRRQLEERTRASQPDPEQQRAEFHAQVRASLDEGFDELRAQPWAKGLTDADLADLRAAAEEAVGAFLVSAPEDDPENGIRKGETLFHAGKFSAFMQRNAGAITRARSATQQSAAAAQRNAAALQTTVSAPPSVGGNRTATPAATKPKATTVAKPLSAAEQREIWRKEMGLTV